MQRFLFWSLAQYFIKIKGQFRFNAWIWNLRIKKTFAVKKFPGPSWYFKASFSDIELRTYKFNFDTFQTRFMLIQGTFYHFAWIISETSFECHLYMSSYKTYHPIPPANHFKMQISAMAHELEIKSVHTTKITHKHISEKVDSLFIYKLLQQLKTLH